MSGNVFDSPPTLRRSLRIAQITPSKILSGALNDDPSKLAHHEDYNRPTRLTDQGSRSRSPRAGSRRGTPKKKNGPTNRIDEIVHGEHPSSFYPIHLINYPPPLRMTTPQQTTYLSNESLINSRMKHAKTLDQHEPVNETPFKAFGEWPTDSLITPIVNAQNRRVNQTHVAPLEVLATQHPLRLTSELPTVKVARNKRVEASLERNVFKRKNSDSKNPTRAFFVEVNGNFYCVFYSLYLPL